MPFVNHMTRVIEEYDESVDGHYRTLYDPKKDDSYTLERALKRIRQKERSNIFGKFKTLIDDNTY